MHVNEPGRTEWEGFATATRAAAAGGVTTIVDMPLNSIPSTTTLGALELKQERARTQAYDDVGFWGGAVPGNVPELAKLHDAGVFGFKLLLDRPLEDEMTLSLTCRQCGTVLSADTEDELVALGQQRAERHGHTRPLSREHVLARIRRHNPKRAD